MFMKNILVITIVIFSLNSFASAEQSSFINKNWKFLASIKSNNFEKTFEKLTSLNIDIAGVNIDAKEIDVLINDYDYQNLENNKKNFDKIIIKEVKGISKGPDEEYKNPEEIEMIVEDFATRFPNITKRVSIGKSLEGRDIWAIKISDNPEIDEEDEPTALFNSMHHAREVMSPEVSIDIIETLLTGYGVDSQITNWVDSNVIWVLPMFNVDGNNRMWNEDKWWRKNARGNYGVDLNRNYPTGWNKCSGSSGWKYAQDYRGPSPASEPETQAMMNFISEIRPVFDISYHSYSELVIYPFGCKGERTATREVVEKIGKELGAMLNYKAGTAWELLYNADGGDIDWMYDTFQVIPFVIELNSNSEGFQPSYAKWRDKTVIKNRVGWQHLLNRLSQNGLRGKFSINNIAVDDYFIKIYKENETTTFQTYKGHKTGLYHLVLNPGKYNLEFIVNNQIVKKENVTIDMNLSTLNVEI